MPQIFKFKPQSQEWLQHRLEDITATQVASLFGLNPNQSINAVAKEKRIPPMKIDNMYMKGGRLFEASVITALVEMGFPVEAADRDFVVYVRHDTLKLAASMDAKMSVEQGFYIAELKTTMAHRVLWDTSAMKIKNKVVEVGGPYCTYPCKWVEWKKEAPIIYWLQLQTQMLVSNQFHGLLACLCTKPPYPLIVYEARPQFRVRELIAEEVNRFWDCFDSGIEFKVNKIYKEEMLKLYEDSIKNNEIDKIFIDNSEI